LAAALVFSLASVAVPASAAAIDPTSIGTEIVLLPAAMSVSPTSINFGDVALGTTATRTITITNTGKATLFFASFPLGGFSLGATTCTASLGADQSCTRDIVYQGYQVSSTESYPYITYTAVGTQTVTEQLHLKAASVLPNAKFTVSPTTVDFGTVVVGTTVTRTLTVTNTGEVPLTLVSFSPGGVSQDATTCTATLGVNQSCTRDLSFKAIQEATLTSYPVMTYKTPYQYVSKNLTITTRGVWADAEITVTPTSIDFGNVTVGSSATNTVTIKNTGAVALMSPQVYVSGVTLGGTTCGGALAVGQSCTRAIIFSPSQVGAVTGSVSISYTTGYQLTGEDLTITGRGVAPLVKTGGFLGL